jgi:membrane associated rhomboid family serine protease
VIPLRDINPTERFAIVTLGIIVLNIAVFVYEVMLGEAGGQLFIASFALIPSRLFSHDVVLGSSLPVAATMITSMFLHGGILHISGNMLYLWIFGNNVEDATGRIRYVAFYLLCGLFAAFAHAVLNRTSVTPMIGASGAVSGVLGAYLLLYPQARVVLGMWFVLQFLNALFAGDSGGGVAWVAHIGGFLAGMLLIGPFKRGDVPFGGGRKFRYL